jgi:hypothetical protein
MKRSSFKRKPKNQTPSKTLYKPRRRKIRASNDILHDKAWNVFSKWIRARDGRCVTCGERDGLQAGHFWHNCLDFDEININAQCARCNHYLSGNLAPYAAYLIHKYGAEEFEKLEIRHYLALKGEKRTDEQYLQIIEKYSRV